MQSLLKLIINFLVIFSHNVWAGPYRQITDLDLNEFSGKNQKLREVFKSHSVFATALVKSISKKDGKVIVEKRNIGISELIFDYVGDDWTHYKNFDLNSYFPNKQKDVCFPAISKIEFDESNRLLKIILRNPYRDMKGQDEIIYWNHLTNILTMESDGITVIPFFYGFKECGIRHSYPSAQSKIISKNNLYMAYKMPWPSLDGDISHDNVHVIYLYVNQTRLLRNIHSSRDPIPVYRRTKTG